MEHWWVEKYQCEHCDTLFYDEGVCEDHEKTCRQKQVEKRCRDWSQKRYNSRFVNDIIAASKSDKALCVLLENDCVDAANDRVRHIIKTVYPHKLNNSNCGYWWQELYLRCMEDVAAIVSQVIEENSIRETISHKDKEGENADD
jgi:hypothetical protein